MAYLECKNVTVGYEDIRLCEDVSFSLDEGDFLWIKGEKRVGKSTLLKHILGYEPPLGGTIDLKIKSSEIGFLPQQSENGMEFPASVWEVVMSATLAGMGHKLFVGKAEKQKTSEMLKRLNILDLKKKNYRSLSGGQRQRVLFARALAGASKLLVLDEPLIGLDPGGVEEFLKIIRECKASGLSVIVVSHNLVFSSMANKTLELK